MYNPALVLEDNTHKLLWDFDTDVAPEGVTNENTNTDKRLYYTRKIVT